MMSKAVIPVVYGGEEVNPTVATSFQWCLWRSGQRIGM